LVTLLQDAKRFKRLRVIILFLQYKDFF
jgi:hypothetical protein